MASCDKSSQTTTAIVDGHLHPLNAVPCVTQPFHLRLAIYNTNRELVDTIRSAFLGPERGGVPKLGCQSPSLTDPGITCQLILISLPATITTHTLLEPPYTFIF